MKRPLFLLFLATCACAVSGHAQVSDDATHTGAIKRPTPPPQTAAATSNKPLEVSLSANEKGKSSAPSIASFPSSTEKVYLNFTHEGAKKGQKIEVTWIADDAKGYGKNKKITSNSGTLPGPGSMGSYYLPAKGLPEGKYRVEVAEDGKVEKTVKFAIK